MIRASPLFLFHVETDECTVFKQNIFFSLQTKTLKWKQVFSDISRMITEVCHLVISLESDLRLSPERGPTFPYALPRWQLLKRPDWLTRHYRQREGWELWLKRCFYSQLNLADSDSHPAGDLDTARQTENWVQQLTVTSVPVL